MNYQKVFYSEEVQSKARNICEIASECWRLQLSDSTGFSICEKITIDNQALILTDKSGTGFSRNNISPADLILIDLNGKLLFQSKESRNKRMAPVNVEVHLAGYRASTLINGSIHWHDPYHNAFSVGGKTIHPISLQAKTIGEVKCIIVDDRKEKQKLTETGRPITVPSGFHGRPDVYYVMSKVSKLAQKHIKQREKELANHGLVITHFQHGMFAWGRSLDEAFENAYRSYRNCQTIVYNKILEMAYE